jgi:hypothetical protein
LIQNAGLTQKCRSQLLSCRCNNYTTGLAVKRIAYLHKVLLLQFFRLQINAAENKVIDVYGTRDNSGKPIAVTDIVISSTTDTTYYKFNEQKRLSAILAPNGTQFFFSWISQNKANLTVIGPDGISQLTTQIDFSSGSEQTDIVANVARPDVPLQLSFTPGQSQSQGGGSAVTTQTGMVNVFQCQSLSDAQTYVVAKTLSGSVLGNFPTKRVSKGVYSFDIPSNLAPSINPGEICGDIAGVLDIACIAMQNPALPIIFCARLGSLVASSGFGTAFTGHVMVACGAAMAGLEFYCATLGQEVGAGGPSLAETLCNSPFINRTFVEDIRVTPYVIALPGNVYGSSALVTPNGVIPQLTVNLNSQTTIRTLELIPPAPAAFQSYVAKVDVFCLLAGSLVTISVVGTDGYSNSVNYNITTTQGEGQFTLTVPGAAMAGIRDVVTLKITLPNGTVLTRTAALIFV